MYYCHTYLCNWSGMIEDGCPLTCRTCGQPLSSNASASAAFKGRVALRTKQIKKRTKKNLGLDPKLAVENRSRKYNRFKIEKKD